MRYLVTYLSWTIQQIYPALLHLGEERVYTVLGLPRKQIALLLLMQQPADSYSFYSVIAVDQGDEEKQEKATNLLYTH